VHVGGIRIAKLALSRYELHRNRSGIQIVVLRTYTANTSRASLCVRESSFGLFSSSSAIAWLSYVADRPGSSCLPALLARIIMSHDGQVHLDQIMVDRGTGDRKKS
jgi:hypothetical protein